jgi:hypothetical protein
VAVVDIETTISTTNINYDDIHFDDGAGARSVPPGVSSGFGWVI